jgi:hypothetical protein
MPRTAIATGKTALSAERNQKYRRRLRRAASSFAQADLQQSIAKKAKTKIVLKSQLVA